MFGSVNNFSLYVCREQILNMPNEEKSKIIDALSCLPCGLETEDVPDFCSLAQYYSNKTPSSFREVRHLSTLDYLRFV